MKKILLTNDDGIYAKGLWTLAEELQKIGQLIVVAPDREQSAIGAAVTLHYPLRVSEIKPPIAGIKAYSVEGTPADSVILALGMIIKDEVDIVFSGINEGANLGDDILLSGTIGAALQGYFRGFPAIALSVAAGEDIHFEVAAKLGGLLAKKIMSINPLPHILLNINLPNLPLEEIKGIELTKLAHRKYADLIKEGHDGKREYYWIVRGKPKWNKKKGTGIWAIKKNKISITPLQSDLTSIEGVPLLQDLRATLLQEIRQL